MGLCLQNKLYMRSNSDRTVDWIISMLVLTVCIVCFSQAAEAQNKSQQEEVVQKTIETRRTLANQYLHWSRAMSKKESINKKALQLLSDPVKEPESFSMVVKRLAKIKADQSGPYILDYLLRLDHPENVVGNKNITKQLGYLGHSFAAPLAWEIHQRREQEKEVGTSE